MTIECEVGLWLWNYDTISKRGWPVLQKVVEDIHATYIAVKTSDGGDFYNGDDSDWQNIKDQLGQYVNQVLSWSYLRANQGSDQEWMVERAVQVFGGGYHFLDYEDPTLEVRRQGLDTILPIMDTVQPRYPGTELVVCSYAQPSFHSGLQVPELANAGCRFAPMAYNTAMGFPGYLAVRKAIVEYGEMGVASTDLYLGEGVYDTSLRRYTNADGQAWLSAARDAGCGHVWFWSLDTLLERPERAAPLGEAIAALWGTGN